MKHYNKILGFTLAEVLITLGIIGVVAALTMPTLIQNYQKTVWTTQLKKVVNTLANNFQRFLADEGVDSLCNSSIARCFSGGQDEPQLAGIDFDKYCEYFKLTNRPGNLLLDDDVSAALNKDVGAVAVLNDGSCIVDPGTMFGFIVDVNCDKGPNKWGRDRFVVGYRMSGAIGFSGEDKGESLSDYGLDLDQVCSAEFARQHANDESLSYCYYKIVEDGWKMNY